MFSLDPYPHAAHKVIHARADDVIMVMTCDKPACSFEWAFFFEWSPRTLVGAAPWRYDDVEV